MKINDTLLTREPMPVQSLLLPADAREALTIASQSGKRGTDRGADFDRIRAIERARQWVMNKYPQFFRCDEIE